MTETKPANILRTLLIMLALTFCITALLNLPEEMYVHAYISEQNTTGWHAIVHRSFNSYFYWNTFPLYINSIVSILIFASGCWLCLYSLKRALTESLLTTIVTILFYFLCFGFDEIFIKCLQFYPWLLWLLITDKKISFLALTSVLLSLSALIFTPLIIAALFLHYMILKNKRPNLNHVCALVIPFALIAFFYFPSMTNTDYPQAARVIADDGLAGHLRPYVAPMSEIPFVDRQFVRRSMESLVNILLICGAATTLLLLSLKLTLSASVILALPLSIALDIGLTETYASLMPLAALRRLVPYWYFYPVTPYFFYFTFMFLSFLAYQQKKIVYSFLPLALLAYCCMQGHVLFFGNDAHSLKESYHDKPIAQQVLVSPSHAILKHIDVRLLEKKELLEKLTYKSPNPHNIIVDKFGFFENSKKRLLFDKKLDTRWHTKKQKGNEWIHLNFKREKRIHGIAVRTGRFSSDFPRMIKISGSESCEYKHIQSLSETAHYAELYPANKWVGALKFTESGLPYLTSEGVVNVLFTNWHKVHCVLIEQIGKEDYFDWSVAEIKLLQEK